MGHQLRTGLGIGIGVIAVQLVLLPVAVAGALLIEVDLVRGHIQEGAAAGKKAQALHEIDGAHDIGLVGLPGDPVGIPHDGLGRQVQDTVRLHPAVEVLQVLKVPHIPDMGDPKPSGKRHLPLRKTDLKVLPGLLSGAFSVKHLKKGGLCGRLLAVAVYLCPKP